MKTVSVTEFRSNIKKYLEVAESEKLVIHRNKGRSFVITPLDTEEDEFLLSNEQKKAISEAKANVSEGKIHSHEEAMKILKSRHPKYYK
ncbi:type II toxin-antitoxin system Phd/YefM family antitoxin [Flavobacterium sp.]|uniref:type II toxin-antitoxin system Phd/YefM family antitoxin n=1 Tax=Flavobacterium sp. TaxID=239 RepID=UPI004047C5D2